jgi:hypothetical protein
MAREITIVDMMKMLAPQKSTVDLIYDAMDHMANARWTGDDLRRAEEFKAAFKALDEAVRICYDRR